MAETYQPTPRDLATLAYELVAELATGLGELTQLAQAIDVGQKPGQGGSFVTLADTIRHTVEHATRGLADISQIAWQLDRRAAPELVAEEEREGKKRTVRYEVSGPTDANGYPPFVVDGQGSDTIVVDNQDDLQVLLDAAHAMGVEITWKVVES